MEIRQLRLQRRFLDPVNWMAITATGWLGLILGAPLAPTPLALVAYAVGGTVCHQLADRSFHVGLTQLAVCARCTGIYTGAAAACVWLAATGRREQQRQDATSRRGLRTASARLWLVCGAVPTIVTIVLEQAGLWHTTNVPRALAGVLLGLVVALVAGRAATLHLVRVASEREPAAPVS